MASYFIGALELLAGVGGTIVIKDQTEIEVAAGIYGSIRSLAGVIASGSHEISLSERNPSLRQSYSGRLHHNSD